MQNTEITKEEMLAALKVIPGASIEEWGNVKEMEALAMSMPEPLRETMMESAKHGWTVQFPNGFYANISDTGYGRERGLLELAVMSKNEEGELDFRYDTPITNDVIGFITPAEAYKKAKEVAALPDEPEKQHTMTKEELLDALKTIPGAKISEWDDKKFTESIAKLSHSPLKASLEKNIRHGWNVEFPNGFTANVTDTGKGKEQGLLDIIIEERDPRVIGTQYSHDNPLGKAFFDQLTPAEAYEKAQEIASFSPSRNYMEKVKEDLTDLMKAVNVLWSVKREIDKFLPTMEQVTANFKAAGNSNIDHQEALALAVKLQDARDEAVSVLCNVNKHVQKEAKLIEKEERFMKELEEDMPFI